MKKTQFSIKKILIGLVVVLACAGGYFFYNRQPGSLQTYTATRQTFKESFSASGRVKAHTQAELRFNLPGKVVWLGVKKGDQVGQWQGVASLDQRQLKKNLDKALSLYMTNRWDFQQGREDNNVSSDDLDAYTLLPTIRKLLDKNQFSLDRAVIDVQLEDLALKESVLISPVSGTVVDDGGLVAGENLGAGEISRKVIKVVDLQTLYFEAKLDEIDFGKVQKGQKVDVVLDAYPDKTFTGTIGFIGKQGVESTSGVINILVDIEFNSPQIDLVTNLNGEANFITKEEENVLVIPTNYLKSENGKNKVLVLKDGKQKEREIKIGAKNTTQVQVISGLEAGEVLVISK